MDLFNTGRVPGGTAYDISQLWLQKLPEALSRGKGISPRVFKPAVQIGPGSNCGDAEAGADTYNLSCVQTYTPVLSAPG